MMFHFLFCFIAVVARNSLSALAGVRIRCLCFPPCSDYVLEGPWAHAHSFRTRVCTDSKHVSRSLAHQVKDGRWGSLPVPVVDPDERLDVGADVYGRMRSPWNVNQRPFMTRGLGEMCGLDSTEFCKSSCLLLASVFPVHGWGCVALSPPPRSFAIPLSLCGVPTHECMF